MHIYEYVSVNFSVLSMCIVCDCAVEIMYVIYCKCVCVSVHAGICINM